MRSYVAMLQSQKKGRIVVQVVKVLLGDPNVLAGIERGGNTSFRDRSRQAVEGPVNIFQTCSGFDNFTFGYGIW